MTKGEVGMWQKGVLTGVGIALLGWVWLRMQSANHPPRSTTILLVDSQPEVTQNSVADYLREIEAEAPWILNPNEKSSTK